jgi:hypothetical protein
MRDKIYKSAQLHYTDAHKKWLPDVFQDLSSAFSISKENGRSAFSICLLSFFFLTNISAQQKTNSHEFPDSIKLTKFSSLFAGAGYQKSGVLEFGYGHYGISKLIFEGLIESYEGSIEAHFGKHLYLAPKISAWAAGGAGAMALGIHLIYYTDFKVHAVCLRPEIGIGTPVFKMSYGYDIALTSPIPQVGRHSVTMMFLFHSPAY